MNVIAQLGEFCVNTPFKLLLVVIMAGVACGSAPTVPTPAITAVYVTTTPEVVAPAPLASPTTTTLLPAVFPPQAVAWLRTNAVPFKTSQPGSGFDDLEAVRSMVGDARLVSLGEATHGTHEFFEMKARLFEYLVTEMGFNSFAIEGYWPEANQINDYLQTGLGDPKQLLTQLGFWTWDTQEVLDLILWMRAYNERAGSQPHLSFYGFDMQSPWLAMDNVVQYLQEVNPHTGAWADVQYDCLRQYRDAGQKYVGAYITVRTRCRVAVQGVYDLLVRRQEIYAALTPSADYNNALESARIVVQAERLYASWPDYSMRDTFMAENVGWAFQQAGPNARMVLWAHNGHVGAIQGEGTEPKSMGSYLRDTYGSSMVIFGFSHYQGTFNARSYGDMVLRSHVLPAPLPDSYESFFHSANLPRFLVDLRGVERDLPAAAWLLGPHPVSSIGAVFGENFPGIYVRSAHLPREYDVMIYFQDTTPSMLLPFP